MSAHELPTNFYGSLNKNLFGKSDAFTTIIGMQFLTAFVMLVFDPIMLWLMPDKKWSHFDIALPDNDGENDSQTVVKIAALLRKVIMLVFVIFIFHYL
jgi:hypothetical protein